MSKSNQLIQAVTRSPLFWGILGAAGFYSILEACPPDMTQLDLVRRYFTHHPVEYMQTVLFAIALAALITKLFDILAQRSGVEESLLGPAPATPQSVGECNTLLAKLNDLPERRQNHYYIARLRCALQHVRQHGSADSLDDELKYLSDADAGRSYASFGLFRVIVWAIPILGFLGTVIGITMALQGVNDQANQPAAVSVLAADNVSSPKPTNNGNAVAMHNAQQNDANSQQGNSMEQVIKGLGLKFDTTALALTLSMVLMFIHFYVERAENSLLGQVDQRVLDELAGRFAGVPANADGQFFAVRRMAEAMMQATEALVKRQAELWLSSVDSAAEHWTKMSETAAGHVQTAMSAATAELTHQTETLQKAVEAAGEVTRLEDSLNRNLAALAGSKHFEQTVLSLAATVNMLSAQLTDSHGAAPVRLESSRRSIHAA